MTTSNSRAPVVLINDDNDDADDDDGNLELVSATIFTAVQLPPPKSTVLR